MAAYALSLVEITDPATFSSYVEAVGPIVERHAGRYLTVGTVADVVEGAPGPGSVVLIRFDDLAAARRWYEADDYQAIVSIRHRSARTTVILFEDLQDPG
jgi:uncharacterized protein (DUF1330 family)